MQSSLASVFSSQYAYLLRLHLHASRRIHSMLQAASGVSSSYDALIDLFECLGTFLKRVRIYSDITLTPAMTEICVKIMVELLSVIALATKQVKQGRFSK